ncbi:uncharacterized protein C8orf34 homolog isoform X2 [Saccostrea echinata]|uniref:uncharacterized protein C8orf34 homolog isoform X2 n=1 Tax=Saccostrea echinata TaxID=191078 RepID=UPI002A829C26|nr:uncharacterized protein C8orf34 homolog isoform X2 [Saccostrea echinata]
MNSKTLQSLTDANASLKVMASPQKMQQYMDRHRIGPLFENLMNKVLHDQPDDPLVYLIKVLHKKAGLEAPRDLKTQGVRRSSPERMVRSRSPDIKKTASTWGSSPIGEVERSYDKPWLSSSKKVKPKSEDFSAMKQASSDSLCVMVVQHKEIRKPPVPSLRYPQTPFAPDLDNLQEVLCVKQKPIMPGRKQPKQNWNPDTKVGKTSFDDLFDGNSEEMKSVPKKREVLTDAKHTWATVGLGGDEDTFTSGVYRGPKTLLSEDDPLAGELMNNKTEGSEKTDQNLVSSGHVRGRRVDAKKHRKELEELVQNSDPKSSDSGYEENGEGLEEEDEALELLEDADDLLNEGVTKIPKSGYKLSRILRQRQEDANIKLNIKIADVYQGEGLYKSTKVDDLFDSDEERPATGMSGFRSSPGDSDEEFESVSQVTGPRRPVWNVGEDSDGDTFYPRNSKTSPEVSSYRKQNVSISERSLNQTTPARFEPSPLQSLDSARKDVSSKTWTPASQTMQSVDSVRSTSGGWQIPRYDSETEFSEFGDQSARNRPPRAY